LAREKQTCSVWDFICEIDEIQNTQRAQNMSVGEGGKKVVEKERGEWRLQKRKVLNS
jgi:hypothetical protein